MNANEISDIVSVSLLILTGIVVTGFVVLYMARSRWRATTAGIALLVSKISLAAIIWWSVFANIIGTEWLGRNIVRPALFFLILVAQVMLLRALIKAQRQDPHDVHVR